MEKIMNEGKSGAKELRKFSLNLFCALGFLGGIVLWRKGEAELLFWGIGITILLVGLVRPRILGPVHKEWMGMSLLIGFFMTHLILALMYYFILTPVGLVMKALGKDPLRLKHDQNAKSYWIRRPRTEFARERYERMF